MGVCLVSYAISDENIEQILADPPLIWRVVENDSDSSYLAELERQAKTSLFLKLLGRAKPRAEPRNLSFTKQELRFVDLDKSWDGLNACLRVCVPEAPNFFEGSGQVGDIEVGYGAALYLRSREMSQIGAAYGRVSQEQMIATYRSLDLTNVYPSGLWRQHDRDAEAYLAENFLDLQAFVVYASEQSLGAVIQFT